MLSFRRFFYYGDWKLFDDEDSVSEGEFGWFFFLIWSFFLFWFLLNMSFLYFVVIFRSFGFVYLFWFFDVMCLFLFIIVYLVFNVSKRNFVIMLRN